MFAVTQDDLAAALDAVDGVAGYADPPTAPAVGDAWPMWAGLTRGPGDAWLVAWRVLVVLPADQAVAMDQIKDIASNIADGLADLLYLGSAAPVDVATQAGTLLALEMQGVTE